MGSQCRDLSIGVICSLTPVPVMSRATLFCMHCILDPTKLCCWKFKRPNNELLVFSREVMKACTRHAAAADVRYS